MTTKKKVKKAKTKEAVKQVSKTIKVTVKAQKAINTEPEFQYIPLNSIVVAGQVRSNINTESDSFKALMQSIKDRGILEPLLVTGQDGGGYTLLCGERRLLAAQQLAMETVPVRIVTTATKQDEVIAFQLTENLQREDLNPIDQAQGILSYIQAKLPDNNYDMDSLMSDLMRVQVRPESLSEETVFTVNTVAQISGKSYPSLFRMISLLKLTTEIQTAVSEGTLPVSQGYLFAANLDCPDIEKIFESVMKNPVTNATLTNMLTAWKKPKPDTGDPKIIPMTKQVVYLRTTRSFMEMGKWQYNKPDLRIFLDELRSLCALVEQKIPNAPEPEPDKKKPNNKPQV